MSAAELLERTAADAAGRLRWRVMRRLGICPVSLRGRLLGRRRAMRLACQLVLDAGNEPGTAERGSNPNFDMARYLQRTGGGGA